MKLKSQRFTKVNTPKLPEAPGVYIFQNEKEKRVYIGKSTNIKKRVISYFARSLSEKTTRMKKETKKFSIILVNSELESLLLEAHLVRKYRPKYNFSLKDDKHPLYIRITNDRYPLALTARKIDEDKKNIAFYGPFPSSKNVKGVLKMTRRIFPYAEHKLGKRGCLYSQIGLCQPCPNEIEKVKDKKLRSKLTEEYRSNLSNMNKLLSGKIKFVRRGLEKRMKVFAKEEKFEAAAKIREQIEKLDYITQPITPIRYFLKNPNLIEDIREQELIELKKILTEYLKMPKSLRRIECFDVAHLAGSKPTASMVTFIKAEPEKTLYRHFRIKQKRGQDDIASLAEVAKRRTKYLSGWGIPDLIVVDGGKGQVSSFFRVFRQHRIAVVGLAKRFEQLVIPKEKNGKISFSLVTLKQGPALNLLQRLRNEAHRFARRYHHKLLKKELIPS